MAAVLVALAAVVLVLRPGPIGELFAESPEPPRFRPPAPRPVLAGAGSTSAPTADGLAEAIDGLAADRRLGDLSASIVDLETGDQLYDRNSAAPVVPASVNKVVTGFAVLAARGPNHRLTTRVVEGANPGEVVLVGAGDPTLTVSKGGTYPGAARLNTLAAEVKKQLGGATPTKVLVDSSAFTGPALGPGWDSDIASAGYAAPITALMIDGGRVSPKNSARSASPDIAAGRAFAKLLGVPEDGVASGTAPDGADKLGAVESPPLIRLVEIMLKNSDNVVAETLARQVALAREAEPSFTGAGQATIDLLEEMGVATEQVALSDGSGLSRRNLLTAGLLTSLFAVAAGDKHPDLSVLFSGLPVAGYTGTLDDRFGGGSRGGIGVVRAKTGTLSGVSSLAGVVVDADGRPLGFSLVANDVPGGSASAEQVLDRIVATLAGCGCR
ncbi:MAG: D-alanyl-D-alanine carboxypeptidase/D-alanyl-D-alanine endopeptidase [Micromonosporaceae bacterium]